MENDKENIDHNYSKEVVMSSQNSPFGGASTQSLHLELPEEEVINLSDSSLNESSDTFSLEDSKELSITEVPLPDGPTTQNVPGNEPYDGSFKSQKRLASNALTDNEATPPQKITKTEEKQNDKKNLENTSDDNSERSVKESEVQQVRNEDTPQVASKDSPLGLIVDAIKNRSLTDKSSPASNFKYPDTSTPDRTDSSDEKITPGLTLEFGANANSNTAAPTPLITTKFDPSLGGSHIVPRSEKNDSTSAQVDEDENLDDTKLLSSPEEDDIIVVAMKASNFKRLDSQDYIQHWKYSGEVSEIGVRLKSKVAGISKRLSEVSSISTTSSGYYADSSSGISSEGGSKRDRLSIMPGNNSRFPLFLSAFQKISAVENVEINYLCTFKYYLSILSIYSD